MLVVVRRLGKMCLVPSRVCIALIKAERVVTVCPFLLLSVSYHHIQAYVCKIIDLFLFRCKYPMSIDTNSIHVKSTLWLSQVLCASHVSLGSRVTCHFW